MIPQDTKDQIDEYTQRKIPVGSFLYAVLSNNLFEAIAKADEHNLLALRDIAMYIYNEIPSVCWGSPKIVEKWINSR